MKSIKRLVTAILVGATLCAPSAFQASAETLDTQAPIVVGVPNSTLQVNGWSIGLTSIAWSVNDPEPSSGVVLNGLAPTYVSAVQGRDMIFQSPEICDNAGNCAHGTYSASIDLGRPLLTVDVSSSLDGSIYVGGPGATISELGWRRGTVTFSPTCAAGTAISGLASCSEATSVRGEGGPFRVEVFAKSQAGTLSGRGFSFSIDNTPPAISWPGPPSGSGVCCTDR